MTTKTKQLTAQDLALYLGQECETPEGPGILIGIENASIGNPEAYIKSYFRIGGHQAIYLTACVGVKPLLRPIADMTEEEAHTAYLAYSGKPFKPSPGWRDLFEPIESPKYYYEMPLSGMSKGDGEAKYTPSEFQYLLSIGIDLFGWIDAGLAIDKTKPLQQ